MGATHTVKEFLVSAHFKKETHEIILNNIFYLTYSTKIVF